MQQVDQVRTVHLRDPRRVRDVAGRLRHQAREVAVLELAHDGRPLVLVGKQRLAGIVGCKSRR